MSIVKRMAAERSDQRTYSRMSKQLRRKGHITDARKVEQISRDEAKHRVWLKGIQKRLRA